MTAARFFDIPFAQSGDLTAVPDGVQIDGSVSYTAGFGVAYQTPVASGGLDFPRRQNNQLLFDITNVLNQFQINGAPLWYSSYAASPGYPNFARVLYTDGNVYQSTANNNTTTPGASSTWVLNSTSSVQVFAGGVATGSANHVVLATVTPSGYALVNGDVVTFTAGFNNGGSTDMNVQSTGVIIIKKNSSSGLVALVTGDILAGNFYSATYSSTNSCYVLNTTTLGTMSSLNVSSVIGNNGSGGATILANQIVAAMIANGTITGTQLALSIVLPGSPTTTTQAGSDNSTKLATTAQVQAAIALQGLGSWLSRSVTTIYQAATDGFVVAYTVDGSATATIYSDSSSTPTIIRGQYVSNGSFIGVPFCIPVKRGDYWEATGNFSTIYWLPLGV